MGCPDWPKCFGTWVPPTEASALPEDYKEVYSEYRVKKTQKFCKFLNSIGMSEVAEQLSNDPNVVKEEDFNAARTWTEYGNRLVGFLAGNAVLAIFVWMLLKYRKHRKLLVLSFANVIIIGVEAWFGSIVVATNLVPWTITVHMLLALVIIGIQLYIIHCIKDQTTHLVVYPKWVKLTVWISFIIVFYQMFLGTQVRELIDELVKDGFGRDAWVDKLGFPYYVHRSFSWLVLVLVFILAYWNENNVKSKGLRIAAIVLLLEVIGGVLLAYGDMPAMIQTFHLLLATILFGIMMMVVFSTIRKSANN